VLQAAHVVNDPIVDEQTGSEWTVLGRAIRGPNAGNQLKPSVGISHFWFSWAAFKPETRICDGGSAVAAAPGRNVE
jgi:hypothetical protein